MPDMIALARTIQSASRKGWFRRTPVFTPYSTCSPQDLSELEETLDVRIPTHLRDWLLIAGYGDIDGELSIRKDWFVKIESGPLVDCAQFAQDSCGNFYAFDETGQVFFLSRSEPVFARMAQNFAEFIEELIQRNYKINDWTDTLELDDYEW